MHEAIEQHAASDFTVIYTTSPPAKVAGAANGANQIPSSRIVASENAEADAEPDFELRKVKRELKHVKAHKQHLHHRRQDFTHPTPTIVPTPLPSLNNTDAPLLERYNFFGPGIYMGLLVAVLFLSILFVGFRALLSLEVSYHAFSKEMGPQGNAGKAMMAAAKAQ